MANFRVEKAHGDLLKAAALVRRSVPDVRFLLVGQGPLEDQVRRQAEQLGLGDTVIFAGFREDVPRLAAALDVFALSSRHEGLSIALMEAMALGRPPVVTSVGGLPELVTHDRHGLLVPPGDPAALAAGIVTVLQDPALAERLGSAARRRAADFDIRAAIGGWRTSTESSWPVGRGRRLPSATITHGCSWRGRASRGLAAASAAPVPWRGVFALPSHRVQLTVGLPVSGPGAMLGGGRGGGGGLDVRWPLDTRWRHAARARLLPLSLLGSTHRPDTGWRGALGAACP